MLFIDLLLKLNLNLEQLITFTLCLLKMVEIYVHIYLCTHIFMYVHIYTCTHVYMCTCIYMYTYIYGTKDDIFK